ncbi:MAG: tetratricopeptide repeat protein [Anaerolineae bacterium]|nr:tetratricopeptide repeat protein [Anaerolineae bacterium]
MSAGSGAEGARRRQRAQRLSNRGAAYLQQGDAHNALSLLQRAYELAPDDVPTAINLGGAYILRKQFARAIPVLERAREQEPENEMIWTNLGAAYLGNPVLATDEQQRQAIAAFERAVEINPVAPNVHYNLALIHRDRGEIEQAMRRFQHAIQANPHDLDARRALERLRAQEDQRTDADEPGEPDHG